jgi:hypothetical protein
MNIFTTTALAIIAILWIGSRALAMYQLSKLMIYLPTSWSNLKEIRAILIANNVYPDVWLFADWFNEKEIDCILKGQGICDDFLLVRRYPLEGILDLLVIQGYIEQSHSKPIPEILDIVDRTLHMVQTHLVEGSDEISDELKQGLAGLAETKEELENIQWRRKSARRSHRRWLQYFVNPMAHPV